MATITASNGQSTTGVGQWDMPNSPITKNSSPFHRAEKKAIKLRLGLTGPSGSGKTKSALKFAKALGGKVAMIDTEYGSGNRYADEFDFDTVELTDFNPENYVEMIHAAEKAGYTTIIIDSLSHAWMGENGMLDQSNLAAKRSRSGNTFQAWNEVKPLESALWKAILGSSCHIIATMRSKTEYIVEKDNNGKSVPRKIGLAPVQRQDSEYEFDIVGDLDHDHNITFGKTRCSALERKLFNKPGQDVMDIIIPWLGSPEAIEREEVEPTPAEVAQAQAQSDAEDAPTETYPMETGALIERCINAEEFLRTQKVKGFMTVPQCVKSRSAYMPNGVLVQGTADQLLKYIERLNDIADSLPQEA